MNRSNNDTSAVPLHWTLFVFLAFLTGCSSFQQTPDQIYVRDPGNRFLDGPRPVGPEAVMDWPFAGLSEAAYGRSTEAAAAAPPVTCTAQSKGATGADDPDSILMSIGWCPWNDFLSPDLASKIRKSHLRVEVWERRDPSAVAVAFGGTVATSGKDWASNLRWFIPFHEDEYTEIVKYFGPAFVDEFVRRMNTPEGAHLKTTTLYATGHSLGGGLAQQFAYALPMGNPVPRVAKVYAFDPSPVTGFFSVPTETRDFNKTDLATDRTYERGEILAILRAVTSIVYPPTARSATIREVRYDLFYSLNPIASHSISELAQRMQAAGQASAVTTAQSQ
jgi:hypothetical protein